MSRKSKEQELIDAVLNFDAETTGLDQLLEAVIEQFGGVNSIARMLFLQYKGAKPGSTQQSRVVELIIKMITAKQSRLDLSNGGQTLDQMTIDQVKAILAANVNELQSSTNSKHPSVSVGTGAKKVRRPSAVRGTPPHSGVPPEPGAGEGDSGLEPEREDSGG